MVGTGSVVNVYGVVVDAGVDVNVAGDVGRGVVGVRVVVNRSNNINVSIVGVGVVVIY